MKLSHFSLFFIVVFLSACSSISGAFAIKGEKYPALEEDAKVSIYITPKAMSELGIYGKNAIREADGSLKPVSEMPKHSIIGKGIVKRYPGHPAKMLEQAFSDARKAGANSIIITSVWSEPVYNVLTGKKMAARRNFIKYDGAKLDTNNK